MELDPTVLATKISTREGVLAINEALGVELPTQFSSWFHDATFEKSRVSTLELSQCLGLMHRCLASDSGLLHEWVDNWQWQVVAVRWEEKGQLNLTVGVGWRTPHRRAPTAVWPELNPWSTSLEKNRARLMAWARVSASDRIVVPVRTRRAQPERNAQNEHELRAAIVAAPDDPSRRLVYADALAERGDPLAELIRLQLSDEANPRIAEILRASWSTFAGELAPYAGAHSFRRGFVEHVSMTIAAFAKHGERLFSTYPLQELEIRQQYTPKQLEQLAKAPGLRLVKKLRLASIQLRPLAPLRTGDFASLRELVVFYCGVDALDLELFFSELKAPRLETLRIQSQVEFPQAIRTGLARNRGLTALKQIQIGQGQ